MFALLQRSSYRFCGLLSSIKPKPNVSINNLTDKRSVDNVIISMQQHRFFFTEQIRLKSTIIKGINLHFAPSTSLPFIIISQKKNVVTTSKSQAEVSCYFY